MSTATPAKAANTRYSAQKAVAEANAQALIANKWKTEDEARQQPMVPLNTGKKYVFRSRPGTLRGFSVRVPRFPDEFDFKDEKQRQRHERAYDRRRERKGGDEGYDLQAVRDAVGGDYIRFRFIPGNETRQTTCFYATDDEDVYRFLLRKKQQNHDGLWNDIVVEHPTRMVEINGQTVPATFAGFEAAQAAFMAEPPAPKE